MRVITMKTFLILAVILTSCFANEIAVAQDNDPIMARYEAGDGHNARNAWELMAATGSFEAQARLGMIYSGAIDPKGVEIDLENARYWMEKAVAQRDKAIDFGLDSILLNYSYQIETGENKRLVGPVGMGEVVQWYKLAAETGSGAAGLRLGQIYESGHKGIAVDMVAALDWYEWAAPAAPVALEAAASIHYQAGRFDRALYWLDHAWAINKRGIENVWKDDPYLDDNGNSFATASKGWRNEIYRNLFPDCLPGWAMQGVHHKFDTSSLNDVRVKHSESEIRYPISALIECKEQDTGVIARVFIKLHHDELAKVWRDTIDEYNKLEYIVRERLFIQGRYVEEINGYSAATMSRQGEGETLITSFDVVLGDAIVVSSEVYGSLDDEFKSRKTAQDYLSALDFQKIIDGTKGHGVFQVADDGTIIKP